MKALSFFSYKGGVGRTMALTNIAMRLVEFGKSVFIIDFDLEAPGVPFKLNKYINHDQIESGVVDYIHEFTESGKIDTLSKYVKALPKNNPGDANMWLMPAGNANLDDYWNKLSRINWYNMFYTDGGKGLRFFLDLKDKIKKEYNPDFLLIDSRTGITELSGISLKILADEVVVLFIKNDENIKGTEKVLSFLYSGQNPGKHSPKLHLVLTRVPQHKNIPTKYNQEYKLLTDLRQQFSQFLAGLEPEISVIHTDDRLQMNEKLAFSDIKATGGNSFDIYSEHSLLFEKLFKDKISAEEWEKNQKAVQAEEVYQMAKSDSLTNHEKIRLFSEAITLNDKKWEYFYYRGEAYERAYNFQKSAADFKQSYSLSGNTAILVDLGWTLIQISNYNEALLVAEEALKKEKTIYTFNLKAAILQYMKENEKSLTLLNEALTIYPNSSVLLNSKGDLLRSMKRYEEALKSVFKAIELSPNDRLCHATLAEIYGAMNKEDEFYIYLNIALSKGLDLLDLRSARDAYDRFRTQSRFIELLKSYNIEPEDIFHYGPPLKTTQDNIGESDNTGDDSTDYGKGN